VLIIEGRNACCINGTSCTVRRGAAQSTSSSAPETRGGVDLCIGARERHTVRTADGGMEGADTGAAYTVDDVALKYGACVDEETSDADVAYARFGPLEPTRYHEGWLR
jgi:hypothetical protein